MRTFTGQEFEDEVKSICRVLFSNSLGQGSENEDGRERDGIFWNGDFYTVVEATTLKTKEKAEKDGKKTNDLVVKKRQESNMARGFIVTLYEPTADQRSAVKKYEKTLKIISFDELRSLLFDSISYLRNRSNKPFGSVYDHSSYSFEVPREEFVTPTIIDSKKLGARKFEISDLVEGALDGKRTILTAEYGVGKSMLLREIFFHLSKEFSRKNTLRFPVFINLNEHLGQKDPIELLERHARSNAADPRKLVAAWTAGHIDLIIDGFDELSTRGWTGDHRRLKEFRRSTHAVVKDLIRRTPRKSAIFLSGRAAYFDSENEMREALGAPEETFHHISLLPFDAEQAALFLQKKGQPGTLPQWLPTRPLFINYLINKNILKDTVSLTGQGAYPEGTAWKALLRMIASRESEQSEGVDSEAILRFWSLLATRARQSNALQKSFTPTEMDEVFNTATGNSVTEEERRLLLRLPGLGIASDNQYNRTFIDIDFLNAASAFTVAEYIENPYVDSPAPDELRSTILQLNHTGIQVMCAIADEKKIPNGQISATLDKELNNKNYNLSYDIFSALIQLGGKTEYLTFEGVDIEEVDLCQDTWDNRKVDFSNCIVTKLVLPENGSIPTDVSFTECLIGTLEGRSSDKDVPTGLLISCTIDQFRNSYTVNDGVMDSGLDLGVKVLLVTLRKVYAQHGVSRLESALLRGLDHTAKMIAPEVISIMVKHGFLIENTRQGKTIYSGSKIKTKEALSIMQSPSMQNSDLITECRKAS